MTYNAQLAYYQRNREKILANARTYYINNKDEIKQKRNNAETTYYQKNKEKLLAYSNDYYNKNKDIRKQKRDNLPQEKNDGIRNYQKARYNNNNNIMKAYNELTSKST